MTAFLVLQTGQVAMLHQAWRKFDRRLQKKLPLASAALDSVVSGCIAYQQQILHAPQHEQLPVQNEGAIASKPGRTLVFEPT